MSSENRFEFGPQAEEGCGALLVSAVSKTLCHSNANSHHYPGDAETRDEMDSATQVVAMSLIELFDFPPETVVLETDILSVICGSMRKHFSKPLFKAQARSLLNMALPLFEEGYQLRGGWAQRAALSYSSQSPTDEVADPVATTLFPASDEKKTPPAVVASPDREGGHRRASMGESSVVGSLFASADKYTREKPGGGSTAASSTKRPRVG